MVTFLDGPAWGQQLWLRRSPVLLRVTIGPRGKLDALDQPGDTPLPLETVRVYRLAARPTWMHMRARGGMGGTWAVAGYRLLNEEPEEAVLRSNEHWDRWCDENRDRLLAEWGHELGLAPRST